MTIFARKKPVITDKNKIDELLTRGVERIYPNREALETKLKSGTRLTLYFGIDPTAATLHLGNAVSLLKLRVFQELGHEVIILYGGFTAQIGDPTDKMSARQPLSPEQIKKNATNYKKLIGKILDLKTARIRFLDNEEWTNKLKPRDLIDLASCFTVSQILERDMFQERLKRGKEIHIHELLYPIFQAYDAVTMDVDVQIGGNDQTFNMLAGRTLMRKLKNKEKFVIAMKMLVDQSSGKKMGKTEGNMVSLNESPKEMFGQIMSWPDAMIVPAFELCTRLAFPEIAKIKTDLENGANPKDSKMKLSYEIVALYHGEKLAGEAQSEFIKVFSDKRLPDVFPETKAKEGACLADIFIENNLSSSKSDFRRLIDGGGVADAASDEKISDPGFVVKKTQTFRVGKHRFIKVSLNNNQKKPS